jgi:hypothetical protein
LNGRTHVLSGVAAGVASLPFAPVAGPWQQVAWVTVVTGGSLLPDTDHPSGTVARMWPGPLSLMPCRLVAAVMLGHRKGTHDVVVGPAVFAGLAWAATSAGWATWLLYAVLAGLTVAVADLLAVPGRVARTVNLLVSGCAAAMLVTYAGAVPWLPAAVAFGCLTHLAGDVCTDRGIPKPFMWLRPVLLSKPMRRRDWLALKLWSSGDRWERFVVAPILVGVIGVVAWAGVT